MILLIIHICKKLIDSGIHFSDGGREHILWLCRRQWMPFWFLEKKTFYSLSNFKAGFVTEVISQLSSTNPSGYVFEITYHDERILGLVTIYFVYTYIIIKECLCVM